MATSNSISSKTIKMCGRPFEQQKQSNGQRISYAWGAIISHAGPPVVEQRLVVGDFCCFAADKENMKSYEWISTPLGPVGVGQVVSISSCQEEQPKLSGASSNSTGHAHLNKVTVFYANVRRFYSEKYLPQHKVKSLDQRFRRGSYLVPSESELEVIRLDQIVPVVIQLKLKKDLLKKSSLDARSPEPGCHLLARTIVRPESSDNPGTVDYYRKDDSLPQSVIDSWNQLPVVNPLSAQQMEMRLKRYQAFIKSDQVPQFVCHMDEDDEEEAEEDRTAHMTRSGTTISSMNSLETLTRSNVNRNKRKTSKQSYPSKRKRVTIVETVSSSEKRRSEPVASKASSKRKRHESRDSISTAPSTDDDELEAQKVKLVSNFAYTPKKGHQRFVERVEYAGWQIGVGDVIAVATDDDDQSIPRHAKSPFDCPWSPAQVLAMYQQDGEWKMQVRWFYRVPELKDLDDVEELQAALLRNSPTAHKELFEGTPDKKMVVEVDEDVSLDCPIHTALGRVVLTTTAPAISKQVRTIGGTKHVYLVCRYLYRCNHIDILPISDWDTYQATLAGPMTRGLLCGKAAPGLDSKLRAAYLQCLRERYEWEGGTELNDNLNPNDHGSQFQFQWPQELLECGHVQVDTRCMLVEKPHRQYFKSVEIPVIPRRCSSRAATSKKSVDLTWTLRVGDVCCIANNSTLVSSGDQQNEKNPWAPFIGPWSVGQVTCVYRDISKNGTESQPMLEVRWFLRRSDLPISTRSWMPPLEPSTKLELFEGDKVQVGVPASHVLGPAEMYLGQHVEPATRVSNDLPRVACRCRFLYLCEMNQFQPLWSSSSSVQDWFEALRVRATQVSKIINSDASLKGTVNFFLKSGSASIFNLSLLLMSGKREAPEEKPVFSTRLHDSQLTRSFFLKASLRPTWDRYASADFLFSARDRADALWFARVGEIVAVQDDCLSLSCYPFTVPWRAAQVLAIFCDQTGTTETGGKKIQVRWLRRRCEVENGLENHALGALYEMPPNERQINIVDFNRLLGPVALFASCARSIHDDIRSQLWDSIPNCLPVALHVLGGEYDPQLKCAKPLGSKAVQKRIAGLVERGLAYSTVYAEQLNVVLDALREEHGRVKDHHHLLQPHVQSFLERSTTGISIDGTDENEALSESSYSPRAWLPSPPFHVDHSSKTEYYSKIDLKVLPPSSFANELRQKIQRVSADEGGKRIWELKLGDIVLVEYPHCFGSTFFGCNSGKNSCFPMDNCHPWAIGEIVTIMRSLDHQLHMPGSDSSDSGIKIQFRWYYREQELPSSKKHAAHQRPGLCETIFETDHYDMISPRSVLAPVELKDRSFPTGGPGGRMERARAQSRYLERGCSAREALDSIEKVLLNRSKPNVSVSSSSLPSNSDWRSSFRRVIQKMSLSDASKEGFENGSLLVGREGERARLKSFLHGAISGRKLEGSKASLFIAGTPGGGKTACVRAVINELHREQSSTKDLPEFNFFALNGMEMRHPNEAYIKLWEAISPHKVRCSPESAMRSLEQYFTETPSKKMVRQRVVVVLLDEVDYLVNEKQSVLYNFFNWPSRSLEVSSVNRLVVVAVSNTLNLRERLLPRVQSRIASNEILFKAYDVKQINAILTMKVKQASPHYQVIDEDALMYAARKTASQSGDIRRAFHFCKKAAETILELNDKKDSPSLEPVVNVKDILDSSRESCKSGVSKRISRCTSMEALLLVAIASLRKTTGREVGSFDVEEILQKMESMANAFGDKQYQPAPSLTETLGLIARLGEARIITSETPRHASVSFGASAAGIGGVWPLVSMSSDNSSIILALSKTKHSALAQKYIITAF